MLSVKRAETLFEQMQGRRILVVGDLMLDRYIHGRVDRISPEAPVPVVQVLSQRSVPGGACNVGLNVQALGGQATVAGLLGTGGSAVELLDHLHRAGVDTSAVLQHPEVTTIVKERVIADRQQALRIDYETLGNSSMACSSEFEAKLALGLQQSDGAVLEDYGKGCLHQQVADQVMTWSREQSRPVGYDPKDNHSLDVRGITFATPNRKEAFVIAKETDSASDHLPLENAPLLRAAEQLCSLWEPEHLMITLGPEGMLLSEDDKHFAHVPTRAREVFDVSGAGDTVIATILLALTAGGSFREAAELANVAAGIVVAKLGTATCTPQEVLHELKENS